MEKKNSVRGVDSQMQQTIYRILQELPHIQIKKIWKK